MSNVIETLHYDVWSDDGVSCENCESKFPSLDVVKQKILAMDQKKNTIVSLRSNDGVQFFIGGGFDQFVVYVEFQEFLFLNLQNKPDDNSGDAVFVTIGGQEGSYSACEVVSLSVALQAAAVFYETGQADPSLIWMKSGDH